MPSAADVLKLAKEKEVKFVDFRFTDTLGKEQHVSVPARYFTMDKFDSGHAFDGSSIAGWKGIQASDMLLMPDPNSARLDPFTDEPVLNISCDVVEPSDGKPYDRCPRGIAKRAEAYLKLSGLGDTAYFGPERGMHDVPIFDRRSLGSNPRRGPFIVEEYEGTTVVPPDASARVDASGNIVIDIDA